MRKLALTIGTMLSGGIVLFLLVSSPEPKYQGRTITAWQDQWAAKKGHGYYEAVEHLGTNALPYAVRNLALNDSSWRTNYARLQAEMPSLLQRLFHKPKPLLQFVDGANVFFHLGSNSIPHAITLLKHDSPTVRRAAALGLRALRRQSPAAEQAIPALIQALKDPDDWVRFNAAEALKEMGPAASNAVPVLTQIVACTGPGPETNHSVYLRAIAAVALGKIGPAATHALPVLRTTLQESAPYLRGQTAVAIWRISADVDTTLPVLLREMPAAQEGDKWDWIVALGEMGPRAKAAVPQLKTELQPDRMPWFLEHVTNALRRIAPEAAAQAGVSGDKM